ncbi:MULTISPECIES: enolase C-terminal domain-like protein [unclassified Variovorax]|uniref:mandelate racemase/muconate lactonizing enzyme family protein n=1 Tax=unclassified Variovorax TaxID=663243 RepID=UPI00076BEF0E|nr:MULTISPECIES: enolase C-terminal domain-like protein [unclassified Variovorax]KWT97025.1 mandelate racemase/muconate lactonizing enzyme family protein [Variovorax sp. WDL1]PNG58580.1 D-Ala-D/L-Ala epimerase [Variovorax sp. B4]PNG61630.1 D-Ala-D/L-Ala epimerase [Variovorax sp. B2]VTV12330.1 L-Ala-D/L-Glu epimerase [Variovorax sp. WDL1]
MPTTEHIDLARIERVEVHRLRVPLTRPYRLAFGDLTAFDTLLVELTDADGATGFGEATLLNGYTDESVDGAWVLAQQLADELAGCTHHAFRTRVDAVARGAPFTATAFGTALDMLGRSEWLALSEPARVPLLALLNADDETTTADEFEKLLDQGYRTVKVKVGLAGSDDLARIRRVQAVVAGRARIRIDANQAFSGPQAAAFLAALDPQDIELFEQPCHADDWAAHAMAVRAARVPMMLDESIYALSDIERAAAEGLATYVKVKLVKFARLELLAGAIERIRALGMRPVLGNGVACDPGCWMEACVAARHIDNAGEMNGYLKVRRPLLANPPRVDRGDMLIEAGEPPVLDRDALAGQRVGLHVARRAMHAGSTINNTTRQP